MVYSDEHLHDVLTGTKTIAVVGLSANPARPSHGVAAFLARKGYRVVGVNPGLGGQVVAGVQVYATLTEIPHDVDMVDVFRKSDAVPAVVDEALARWPGLRTIWMQLGVEHAEAAAKAEARGVTVIQNRCPKIEIPRLAAMGRDVTPTG